MIAHPLHPALVHFPLALWTVSAGTDAVALLTGSRAWWTLSHHALAAGLAFGGLALLTGMAEAMLRRPLPQPAVRPLLIHAGCMSIAFLAFLVSLSLRRAMPPPPTALAVSAAGLLTLLVGGWYGGTLVYRFGVGVRAAGSGIEAARAQR